MISREYKEDNNMTTAAENTNDYDVETLVKMWIEQNKPSGKHIDYDVQDDGSISIFGLIHDGVDYWSQEWEIIADFKIIDELKVSVGV